MTLIIGTLLRDRAVLVADGRRTKPFVPGAAPEDDVSKITVVRDATAVGVCGAEIATTVALAEFANRPPARSPDEYASALEASAAHGWNVFAVLANLETRELSTMRCALLGVGIVGNRPVVVGALRGLGIEDPPVVCTNAFQFIAIGGEAAGAQWDFKRRLERHAKSLGAASDRDSAARRVVTLSAETIRHVSKRDRTIGGQIRYHWVCVDGRAASGKFP